MGKKRIQQMNRPTTSAGSRIYSRENVDRYSERARQRRRGRHVRRIVICTLIGVLLAGTAAAGLYLNHLSAKLRGSSITSDLMNSLKIMDSDVTKEPFYMLLLGTDGRPGEDTFRSDTIVVARIDPTHKQVTLLSIPRDTKIKLNGETMKINAAHAYGGADDVVKAVNELLWPGQEGKISQYAEVSFEGLVQVVDAIGGVEVNVPDKVDDPKAGDMVIEPGLQTLDGASALAFCRSRAYSDGDYTRMRHQRIFIAALAKQVLNNTNATTIVPLIESLSDMVQTSMSLTDIAALANAMRGMDTDKIWSANLPSWAGDDTYINGVSYVFCNEEATAEMMDRIDKGLDPQGSQTMSTGGLSESSTIGDLTNNTASDYVNGTATASGGSDESSSDSSRGSASSSSN